MHTLLIIEDEPELLEYLQDHLRDDSKYNTIGAESAKAARTLLKAFPIDVIITDMILPDINGLSFVQQLREEGNKVPVIFMSGVTDLELNLRVKELGASECFLKPIDLDRIQMAIEKILAQKKR